ncbi:MAG: DUF2092 domain-containing protein [Planctomycetota bacterium]|jgi:hypothetical protein
MTVHKCRAGALACVLASLLALGLLGVRVYAEDAAGENTEEEGTAEVVIDAEADRWLQQMCATLAEAKEFSFVTEADIEVTLDSGELVPLFVEREVWVRRPNRLATEVHGDLGSRRVWYTGGQLTVLDLDENAYASAEVPDNFDDLLDLMIEEHDLSVPLADILYEDPYSVLTENVLAGEYVGLHDADGTDCHHLAFEQEWIEWQIWIDPGPPAVPRKLVITDLTAPERPQFTAVLFDWDSESHLPDETFEPEVPADARRVTMEEAVFGPEGGE